MVWMRDVVCVDSPVDGNPERQQMIFFAVSSATSFFRPRIFRYSESSALQDSRPTRREPENANESPSPACQTIYESSPRARLDGFSVFF